MTDLLRELARAKVEFQLRALRAVILAPGLDVVMTRPMPEGNPEVKAAVVINARVNPAASKPEAEQISTNAETGAAEVTRHVLHAAPVAVHEPKP